MKKLLFVLLLLPGFVFSQATGKSISNKPSGGSIGSAATTVDILTSFNVNQTTAGQTLTVPNLTNVSASKVIYVNNRGTVSFILSPGGFLPPGKGVVMRWDSTQWNDCSNSFANTITTPTGTLTVVSTATVTGNNTGDQDLTGYVPYSGATGNVNLNDKPLININSIAVGTSTLTAGVTSEFRNTGTVGNNEISTSVYSLPTTTFATGNSTLRGYTSAPTTAAGTYTLNVCSGYTAIDAIELGSSVVNQQNGFLTGDLSSGEFNRGFYGDVSAGTNKWNLYMSGTANNFLNGPLQVGTGTVTPNASALIEMGGTDKGLLINRLTTTQMNAISSPATGLLIYNTTASSFYKYDGGWAALSTPIVAGTGISIAGTTTNTITNTGVTSIVAGSGVSISGTTTPTITSTGLFTQGSGFARLTSTTDALQVGTSTVTLSASLGVKGQGATSATTTALFQNSSSVLGWKLSDDGSQNWKGAGNSSSNSIYVTPFSTTYRLIQYGNENNANIGVGYKTGTMFTESFNGQTVIGMSAYSTSAGCTVVGYNSRITAGSWGVGVGANIIIGGKTIWLGGPGAQVNVNAPTGTNSVILGYSQFGNAVTASNVAGFYFDNDYPSLFGRSNGSFGLLGQTKTILYDGTNALYGVDTHMGTGGNTLTVATHTAVPSTNVADAFQLYAFDITAGNTAPHFRTEAGDIIKLFKGAVLTTGLTPITHDAPGTPDYNYSGSVTNVAPYGFTTSDELNTLLSVIKNLQTKVEELEDRLQASGQVQ